MVTSLFAGTGERTLGAALENLQLCAATAPGSRPWTPSNRRPFTVGKSMAVRRRDLAVLGGFQPVGHVLAEDMSSGGGFSRPASRLAPRSSWSRTATSPASVSRTIERHTRWAKMRRSLSPAASPPSRADAHHRRVRGSLAAPCELTAAVLARCALLRPLVPSRRSTTSRTRSGMVVRPPRDRAVLRGAPLLGMCVVSRRIAWRGHPFSCVGGA